MCHDASSTTTLLLDERDFANSDVVTRMRPDSFAHVEENRRALVVIVGSIRLSVLSYALGVK